MHVDIAPTMTIDTRLLEEQRELIGKLVDNLCNGRTGIAIKRDLSTLIGIQGILDRIADDIDPVEADGAPDCPGCTAPGNCEDCEYVDDPHVDPVCSN